MCDRIHWLLSLLLVIGQEKKQNFLSFFLMIFTRSVRYALCEWHSICSFSSSVFIFLVWFSWKLILCLARKNRWRGIVQHIICPWLLSTCCQLALVSSARRTPLISSSSTSSICFMSSFSMWLSHGSPTPDARYHSKNIGVDPSFRYPTWLCRSEDWPVNY